MSTARKTSSISVVIPTLNEENNLLATLQPLMAIPALEIIIVDGGSRDKTLDIAKKSGAIVVHSKPGRAVQQNLGAEKATGDILLFLHADTRLPPGFDHIIRECLNDPGKPIAGAFSLSIDLSGLGIRFIEWMASLRSRWLHLPYGDQALFMMKGTFEEAGKFPEIDLMEDFALAGKLKKSGHIRTVPEKVITAGRRWQELGVLKTTLINQGVIIGYLLGRSPTSLASWYRRSSRAR
ncbi:MAG: TIGR04283 family arsenosugar biosynthesis glycosyltransferase [Thermodesulfobacteriota bacterium]